MAMTMAMPVPMTMAMPVPMTMRVAGMVVPVVVVVRSVHRRPA